MPIEQWRAIAGYEGRYDVSDQGRVRSLPRNGTRKEVVYLKPFHLRGYARVTLRQGRDRPVYFVHRLVLEAFVRRRLADEQCRHLNGNSRDNRLCNIVWGTAHENMIDRQNHGTVVRGARHHKTPLTDEDVREIRRMRAAGVGGPTLSKRFGISHVAIYKIAKRETWAHLS